MEWLGGGGGKKSPSNSAGDIAEQLQNLLQIPAIEKKVVPVIQPTATQNATSKLVPNATSGNKCVPMYCSELEAYDMPMTGGPQRPQQKEGKENLFPHPVGAIRVLPNIRGRGRGGNRTIIQYPAQSKPATLSRRFLEKSKVTKKEIKDYTLGEYLKKIDYDPSSPSSNKPRIEGEPEFPSFIETVCEMDDSGDCPSQMYIQQDLLARNAIKLDGIENIGEHFATIDHQLKVLLRTYFIEPLSRRTMKHPKAKFLCNLCPYHIDSLVETIEHLSCRRHCQLQREQFYLYTLESVPMASDQHCDSIGELITQISYQHELTERGMKQREMIVDFVENILKENGMNCEVSMFGSTACDLAFSFSDLNINVTFGTPEEISSSAIQTNKIVVPTNSTNHLNNVARIVDILTRVPQFRQVNPKYLNNKTHVTFVAEEFGEHDVQCLMQFNNKPALLLAGLFKEYMNMNSMVRPIVMAFRYWAHVCQLDDQENGLLPAHAYPIMAIQYLQEIRMLPVLQAVPRVDSSRPFATAIESFKAGFPNNSDRKFSNGELGKLWLSLLYYFAVKFDHLGRVVTISRSGVLNSGDSVWNRKFCIEDPIIPSSNLSRSISNNKVCDYIVDCIKTSFLYFAIPNLRGTGHLYDGIFDDRLVEDEKRVFFRHLIATPPPGETQSPQKHQLRIVDSNKVSHSSEICLKPAASFKMICSKDNSCRDDCFILYSTLSAAHTVLKKDEYFYEFDPKQLRAFGYAPLTCKACGSEDHIRRNCPEESLPRLTSVQRPSNKSLLLIRRITLLNYEKLALNEVAYRARLDIKNHVFNLLVEDFPDVQLTMFGSSENGFGLKSSDLDLCMSLRSQRFLTKDDILRYIDVNDTLAKIVNCLKRSTDLADVFSITTAKVPIVKYRHEPTGLDGDISFYNLLALRNTLLLKTYNQLDARVKIIGCLMKKLGKLCEISDASKGSLNSYGYMVMLIHYLQHTKVPVLPVLQEIPPLGHPPNEPLPTFIVENFDSYFFEDLTKMQYAWNGYGRNTDPVEELWLGFLRYYTEVFDFENHVVSISRHSPLTRREKAWFTECIAVEDPFEKAHNLGSGLTKRMSVHIIKTLRKFRNVFHSDVEGDDVASARMHYFNRHALKDGKLPIDRQCRICHRIGHIARQCLRREPSDTESLDGDDDDDLITTRINEHGAMVETPSSAARDESIDYIPVPLSNRNADVRPTHTAPLHSSHYSEKEAQKWGLDDFRYFWNMDTPKNHEEMMLEKMITSSPGVSFSKDLKEKAVKMQDNTARQYNQPQENTVHQVMPQANWNGTFPTNFFGGAPNLPQQGYSLQDTKILFDPTQSNRLVLGPSYPPGMLRLPPPPPGFAPRGLPVPAKLVVPTMMTNGMGNGNGPQQMYRFAGFGQYMNMQQLPNTLYQPNNGAFNYDGGPPVMDSLSWQNPHIPVAVRQQQARQWDNNRH